MRYLLIIFLLLFSVVSFSQNNSFVKKLPDKNKMVNDYGRFLTSTESDTLEVNLKSFLKKSNRAIIIVTLDSLTDPKTKMNYSIEEAALLYFNQWGIGDTVKKEGVLIMVSRSPRRVRIQVGDGLVNQLSNEICKKIIDSSLVPDFKQGLFFKGINKAVNDIESWIDPWPLGEYYEGSPANIDTGIFSPANKKKKPPYR